MIKSNTKALLSIFEPGFNKFYNESSISDKCHFQSVGIEFK